MVIQTFNRTAYGIEIHSSFGNSLKHKAFNRTAYGIEIENMAMEIILLSGF